jgi:selenocysteine-specific elongation factor
MISIIVGTAGHIDHGKSALVRALTGTDPDRLPEEKRRGITIDLGFADLTLDDVHIGFVDVPGHERFVKNMLAGAHGIDLLALVIAADEGVMPQTREHFDIGRLLGINNGLVVITKSDLVDSEMLQLVEAEAKELVANSFLANAPFVAVSARTGDGLDQLKAELKRLAHEVHDTHPRSKDLTVRLPIDRAFSMKGFGAVVTGTLVSGTLDETSELELLPAGKMVRIRGIQVHGEAVKQAHAGQRTALNLAGVEVGELERGVVLAPAGRLRPTQILDVKIEILPDAARGVRTRSRVRVHLGTAEVLGKVRVLEHAADIGPGQSAIAQLRLESPIVALHGDRFILRGSSPITTIGGGVVIDPLAAKHRGKGLPKTLQLLNQMLNGDRTEVFAALVTTSGEHGMRASDVAVATGWNDEVIQQAMSESVNRKVITELGGVFFAKGDADRLTQKLLSEVDLHHRNEPLTRGMNRQTLREKVFAHAQPETFDALVSKLEGSGFLITEKEIVRLQSHKVDLSEKDTKLQELFEQLYLKAGLETVTLEELMTRAQVPATERVQARKVLQLLIDKGKLVRVQGEMFMHEQVITGLKQKLLDYGLQHEPDRLIDVTAFKDLAAVSRKYAIPLLEYFDRAQVTRRAGDKRVILRPRS